ncbi:MAG: hypothetical protein AB1394_03365 [Bacteroidota bacterium]
MKSFLLASVIALCLLISTCSHFQKDSFEGNWKLKLTGSIQETFDIVIGDNNTFSVNKSISYGSQDYYVELKGKIEKDGKIDAEIIASGQSMGSLEGLLTFETGKGRWNASILYGEWTAAKK